MGVPGSLSACRYSPNSSCRQQGQAAADSAAAAQPDEAQAGQTMATIGQHCLQRAIFNCAGGSTRAAAATGRRSASGQHNTAMLPPQQHTAWRAEHPSTPSASTHLDVAIIVHRDERLRVKLLPRHLVLDRHRAVHLFGEGEHEVRIPGGGNGSGVRPRAGGGQVAGLGGGGGGAALQAARRQRARTWWTRVGSPGSGRRPCSARRRPQPAAAGQSRGAASVSGGRAAARRRRQERPSALLATSCLPTRAPGRTGPSRRPAAGRGAARARASAPWPAAWRLVRWARLGCWCR